MPIEVLLTAGLAGLGLAPLLLRTVTSGSLGAVVLACAAWAALVLAAGGLASSYAAYRPTPVPAADRPTEIPAHGYVSSDACAACHPRNHASWHDSYHRTMTQPANADTVAAQFDVRFEALEVEFSGERYRLYWRDGGLRVSMPDPDATLSADLSTPRIDRPIVQITGSHHRQVFWYPVGQGRLLGQLPVVYLVQEQRWIPRNAAFVTPPVHGPASETGRWNTTCIRCHTTNGRPRYENGRFDTQVSELGIACEACHGPGAEHVQANRNPWWRYWLHLSGDDDPTIVNPARLDAPRAADVCGQCHSTALIEGRAAMAAWVREGPRFRPGDRLAEHRFIPRPGVNDEQRSFRRMKAAVPGWVEQRFWSDGVVRVSGREYHATIDSPCFAGGEFSCLSCHRMHQASDDTRAREDWTDDQLAVGMDGDRACLQCHTGVDANAAGDPWTAHTHHLADSSGSRCQNCHMPYTSYGLLKGIRNHRIESPSVQMTVETGRPNACNQCHLDRPLGWASTHLEAWYGIEPPTLEPDQREIAASVLWALRGDAGQRALAAWSMGWPPALETSGNAWVAPYLAVLMDDPYDAVRLIARKSFRRLPGHNQFELDPMAGQPARAEALRFANAERDLDRVPSPRRAAVLLSTAGALQRGEMERLLEQRDHRAVTLSE